MLKNLSYIESNTYNPYQNLALEEYLLETSREDECMLYLWQNEHTVVIGKNQNAWKECWVSRIERDGVYLTRRISGGGAVYHDLGNLNFTFFVNKGDFDVARQMNVIKNAVGKWGIHAEISGRNDITIGGKKFSGNAFCTHGKNHCYHHGTLMVDVKKEHMHRYLSVPKEKLESKGVDSVHSRTVNLKDLCPEITVDGLKRALKEAFEEEYGKKATVFEPEIVEKESQGKIQELQKRHQSREWIYGKKIAFSQTFARKFIWGSLTMELAIQKGMISEIMVYTDALSTKFADEMMQYLKGAEYNRDAMRLQLEFYRTANRDKQRMMEDVIAWLGRLDL